MKKLVRSLLVVAAIVTSAASYADYPERPIRIIVPYAPGGTTDAISRMVGQKLSASLGQPVLIDNRPGGSEQIAMNAVTKAPADGYTIMISTLGGLAVNPSLYGSKLSYNPQKDLAPIVMAVTLPSIVFVHPSVPANTIGELTAYIKKNPGKVSYGSSGPGQASHLAMEIYKKLTGIDVVHVPYKGGAPALQDLVAGQVQVMIAIGAEGMPFANAGKLKALAVTTPARTPLYPQLPPVADSEGMKGFDIPVWFAYVAPAGIPKAIVEKLNHAINAVLQDKEIRGKLTDMGIEVVGGTAQALEAQIGSDTIKWGKVVRDAGIKLD